MEGHAWGNGCFSSVACFSEADTVLFVLSLSSAHGGSQIQVVDGAALEEISGECFAAAKRNIDKVQPK